MIADIIILVVTPVIVIGAIIDAVVRSLRLASQRIERSRWL